nr:hypothetical protein [uncultured Kingella sp.]
MKKQMIAIALAASFAAPAFAGSFEEQMFDTQPEKAKVVELSQKEMRETEGAFGPWGAAIGGFGGAAGYVIQQQISGDPFSWGKFSAATGFGAATGAVSGPMGVVWGFNSRIAGGTAYGVYKRINR